MKKVSLIFLILLWGCTKPELPTPTMPVEKIFTVNESKVVNGQSIYFDLILDPFSKHFSPLISVVI